MDGLTNTLVLGAVAAAAFPIAFLGARLCLTALLRSFGPGARKAGAGAPLPVRGA